MPGKIFISYRRGEDSGFAGRLFDSLQTAFDPDQIFMDVDSIEPGMNFVRVLQAKIAESDVVLAIIGRHWIDAADSKGNLRLENPKDFVRTEIEAALNQEKLLIPVLVGDAEIPPPERLPESLRVLTELHALRVQHERYRVDAEGLIRQVKKILDRAPRMPDEKGNVTSDPAPQQHEPEARQKGAEVRLRLLENELGPYVARSLPPAPATKQATLAAPRGPSENKKPPAEEITAPVIAAEVPPDASLELPSVSSLSSGSSQASLWFGGKINGLSKTRALILLIAVFAVSAGTWYGWSTFLLPALEKPAMEAALKEKAPTQLPKDPGRSVQPSPGSSPATPVAQRVVLYDEDPADPKGKQYVGTVVWRTEPIKGSTGQPADIAVRADIDIPDRKFKMTMSFRRNTDTSLPASHTAELTFTLPPDFVGGGVGNVPGILMKSNEQARGTPLAGLAVKVTDGFFLVGFSNVDADRTRNIQLLKERSWFDVPLVYLNQRRSIIAIEKGPPGERAFNDAFAAWGE